MQDEILDLGEGHSIRILRDGNSEITAVIDSHQSTVDGSDCGGIVPIGHDEWRIVSGPEEPLTIVPSVDCDRCDSHGVILEGTWQVAKYQESDVDGDSKESSGIPQ